jgi:hypothetical protein
MKRGHELRTEALKVWLDVPFSEDGAVNALGGCFDPEKRKWWCGVQGVEM